MPTDAKTKEALADAVVDPTVNTSIDETTDERNTEQLSDQLDRPIPQPIDDTGLDELNDDDMIGDYLITKKQLMEWKNKWPHSRFIYFEYFDEPFVLRSYTWGDFEQYNQLLAKMLEDAQNKKKVELLKQDPDMKPEEVGKLLDQLYIQPRIQNYHFLKMVLCNQEDIADRLLEKSVDAGLPQAIIDLAHRASGFGEIQAQIL